MSSDNFAVCNSPGWGIRERFTRDGKTFGGRVYRSLCDGLVLLSDHTETTGAYVALRGHDVRVSQWTDGSEFDPPDPDGSHTQETTIRLGDLIRGQERAPGVTVRRWIVDLALEWISEHGAEENYDVSTPCMEYYGDCPLCRKGDA